MPSTEQNVLTVRPMYASDLDTVMSIEARAYPYPWSKLNFVDCLKHNYECWVSEQEGVIIAYSVLMLVLDELSILNICVHPDYQRQGLGRALLNTIMAFAQQREVKHCFLEVRPSNTQALRLYTHYGFHEVGIRKRYYPAAQGREDAIIMAKTLFSHDFC